MATKEWTDEELDQMCKEAGTWNEGGSKCPVNRLYRNGQISAIQIDMHADRVLESRRSGKARAGNE